ncbi:hypothetical protein HMPREF9248_0003 [Fannyhessea vaginae PB189-T1-4]|uniref:Uncharacterized protein n=1 Tax=Fannyhessea vaginae PB189-T1-4 TaxID=866774 RepID=A0ABN0B1H7_9ACTN|nr:hypothetical protein HMPREF9248_0003 [Fannyhessea vaginae PB189-T1-4]
MCVLDVRGILLSKLKKFYTFESAPALHLRRRPHLNQKVSQP